MASHSCKKLSPKDQGVLNSIFNPQLPYSDVIDDAIPEENEKVPETPELVEAKRLEVEGVRAAEARDLHAALDLFNAAVCTAPEHASAYNNRAQVLRLMNDTKGALEDLNMAISLSNGKGAAGCQAYTQRGLLHRLEGEDEAALKDLKAAAKLGSEFAKTLVIQMNPYTALCNEMLAEVVGQIRRGEQ